MQARGAEKTQTAVIEKTPKIAGAASPFGSGDLKSPSPPPSAKAFRVGDSHE